MTELHAGLELFREQLREAIARDLAGTPPPRNAGRLALRLAPLLAGAAAATGLVMAFTGGTPVQSADAAILRHVAAALSSPAGTILHERAMVTAGSTTQPYELWTQSDPPHRYRVIKWGHQGTGASGAPDDPAIALRSLVESGQAAVDSSTTFDGVPAYKLTVSGSSDRFLNGTVYVSRSDYHPLLIDTTGNGGEQIRFQTYEYLPATPANLQSLRVALHDPGPSNAK